MRVCSKGKIANSKKIQVLGFGCNQMGDDEGLNPGIHAEQNAISKLVSIKNKKYLEDINILVIRLSKKNKLQSSKPCNNCIRYMKVVPSKKGYNIKYVYYSDSEENIIKTTINELEKEEQHYSRFFRKR